MERRIWPWRRKSSKKSIEFYPSTPVSPSPSPRPCKDLPPKTYSEQQAEVRVNNLTERLAAALSDVAVKEELVKQHSKVAEEAVSGWERAEEEASTLKKQLEALLQQKIAAEDHAVHLDLALKECMRQVRHVRDKQEQKIHDTILRKNQEWEKIRSEVESKQLELENQLLESRAENSAMSESLQEHVRIILEMSETKGMAEAEVRVLQDRLESSEKEISAMNYELHVLNKELEIRNEEREYNRKASNAAYEQHLDNVKKIAKLESECQRLRALIRKKLPGPAALAQMRLEVEGPGSESGEGRRSVSKNAPVPMDGLQKDLKGNSVKELELLTDRLQFMEEETKLLKEALVKRNEELQTAQELCARTASKLSAVEEKLEYFSQGQEFPNVLNCSKEAQLTAMALNSENDYNKDEARSAESCTLSLTAQPPYLRKDKASTDSRHESMVSSNVHDADDFLVFKQRGKVAQSNAQVVAQQVKNEDDNRVQEALWSGKTFAKLESALQTANKLCKDVGCRFTMVEEQLSAFKSESKQNEATLAQIQQSLGKIFNARDEVSKLETVLDEVRTFVVFREEPSNGAAVNRDH